MQFLNAPARSPIVRLWLNLLLDPSGTSSPLVVVFAVAVAVAVVVSDTDRAHLLPFPSLAYMRWMVYLLAMDDGRCVMYVMVAQAAVPDAIKALKEKKAWFSEQPRPTATTAKPAQVRQADLAIQTGRRSRLGDSDMPVV